MGPHFCDIERALGHDGPCAREHCPFWQEGGCVVAGGRPDLHTTAGLPELLLLLRHRLADNDTGARDHSLLPGEYL